MFLGEVAATLFPRGWKRILKVDPIEIIVKLRNNEYREENR